MTCKYIQFGGTKTQHNTVINNLFKEIIGKKPVVVLYFADWCQHCKDMKPEWEQAIESLNIGKMNNPKKVIHGDFNKYVIALEAGAYDKKLCPDVDPNVSGFPTINYYPNKSDDATLEKKGFEGFEGERNAENIKNWLADKLDLGSVQSIPTQDAGKRRKSRKSKKRRKSRKTKRRKRRKSHKSKRRR
jgi:thiol-disulfide isomerase/thioredoxin